MKFTAALEALPEAPRVNEADLANFASYLEDSETRRNERLEAALSRQTLGRDIVNLTLAAHDAGDTDEALWRAFLGAYFGEPLGEPEAAMSAAKVLCDFGTEPAWTWTRIWGDPVSLLRWSQEHRNDLRELPIGNQRKREAKPDDQLYAAIFSFVRWIHVAGGTPTLALQTKGETPEARFDNLFRRLHVLPHFGRMGCFDFLCLLGDLDVMPIRPGSCYLPGSSVPLNGAKRLWGRWPQAELSHWADTAATQLGVDFAVFEDALCNWQKAEVATV